MWLPLPRVHVCFLLPAYWYCRYIRNSAANKNSPVPFDVMPAFSLLYNNNLELVGRHVLFTSSANLDYVVDEPAERREI